MACGSGRVSDLERQDEPLIRLIRPLDRAIAACLARPGLDFSYLEVGATAEIPPPGSQGLEMAPPARMSSKNVAKKPYSPVDDRDNPKA